ncbi:DNA ligase [Thalassotalea fonticola]|uniref:DNA ligase n=1 Tax=Thalassotalea fonticola TaxID=3065649 RepID=A0ABZ0GUV6_9GAMM|nr:DNA ligase [Colwelliaceae bacterium S1-1]
MKTLTITATLFFTSLLTFVVLPIYAFEHSPVRSQAPALQHSKVYSADTNINISEYYVSEKLDGVRGYWDGDKLMSRNGNVFAAPAWFTKDFPPFNLDGELWMGRGKFSEVLSVVSRDQPHIGWQKVRFMIFDLPEQQGNFANRVTAMRQLIANSNSQYLQMIQQIKISTDDRLIKLLEKIIKLGGEGLMLHRETAHYHIGKTNNLLKLKTYQDSEAQVIAHTIGKGKYQGLLGALIVRNKNGIIFKVGSGFSDKERAMPPPIGSIITYKYWGVTSKGKPRFASFLRMRKSL